MSSCVIIQQEKNIFMAADTAISCNVGGDIKRLSNEARKIFRKDDCIVFCSGNMSIADICIKYIENMDRIDIPKIKKFVSNLGVSGMFEVFIAQCDESVTTYQISSYNNFKVIERKLSSEETQLFSIGFKTQDIMNSVEKYIYKNDVVNTFLNAFNDNVCTEVGGMIDIYHYFNGSIGHKKLELDDKTECIVSNIEKSRCSFVIAETIFGRLILGEKLVITSDDGLFYVGDGETAEQKKNKEFGLYIYNNVGGVDRIFLGLSKDKDGVRRAKLRLKDATGKQVVLSEEGIVQTSQFVCWDNVSPGYPMRIPYFCDDGVKENRRIILSMVFEKYRAFERGMTAGGKLTTSSSGGGGTSAAGGGGTSAAGGGGTSSSGGGGTSASGGGGTSASGGGGTSSSGGGGTSGAGGITSLSGGGTTSYGSGADTIYTTSEYGGGITDQQSGVADKISLTEEKRMTTKPLNSSSTDEYSKHYHGINADFFLHRHNIRISIPSHSHSVSVSTNDHYHTLPDHTHNMDLHTHQIYDHNHQVYNHTHEIYNHTHQIYNHTHQIADHTHQIYNHTHQIADHTHTLDTTHSHNLEYGIFEQGSRCSGVKVYINNVLVNASANINSDVDLDITKYIKIGQRNDIRITTNTNGRISCNLFTKSFVAF